MRIENVRIGFSLRKRKGANNEPGTKRSDNYMAI